MLRQHEMRVLLPSRMVGPEDETQRKTGHSVSRFAQASAAIRNALLLIAAGAGFFLLGAVVQQADPTAGWLDIGMLSLPLYAAWCCLFGLWIAGLLPALIRRISRRGGITKWQRNNEQRWSLLVFLAYVALLCILL